MNEDFIRIPPVFRRGIESSLGRSVALDDQGSIQDLRKISASAMADLKKISDENNFAFAERYLRYLAHKKNHKYLMDFLSEVVQGEGGAASWRSSIIVYIDIECGLYKHLDSTHSAINLLRDFAKKHNGILGEIPLVYNPEFRGLNYTGCPGVIVENFNYLDWPGEPFSFSGFDASAFKVSEPKNLEVLMFRHWMALSARCIIGELRDPYADAAEIKSKLLKMSGLETITPLLQRALDVLLKEREMLGCEYGDESPPGYCIDESHFIDLLDIS